MRLTKQQNCVSWFSQTKRKTYRVLARRYNKVFLTRRHTGFTAAISYHSKQLCRFLTARIFIAEKHNITVCRRNMSLDRPLLHITLTA